MYDFTDEVFNYNNPALEDWDDIFDYSEPNGMTDDEIAEISSAN